MHPANARPIVFGVLGVALGLVVAYAVRLGLDWAGWLSSAGIEPVFAGFVTAGVAGGAAGLTYTNLLYKRAESVRGERTMHQETLRVAAELIDSEEELKLISGAKLLVGLIELSPTHAQTAAEILCARLRREFHPAIDTLEFAEGGAAYQRRYEADQRMRNAVAESIASVTRKDSTAVHVRDLRWMFSDVEFGTRTSFDGCVFGAGTTFLRTRFGADTSFRGAWFLGAADFEDVHASEGIDMRGLHAEAGLSVHRSNVGASVEVFGIGLILDHAELEWLALDGVKSMGPIRLDDTRIVGDVRVTDSTASYFSLIDAQCDRALVINGLRTDDYLCVRRLDVRKGVHLANCEVGGELEVRGVRTDGAVELTENHCGSMTLDE